MTDELQTATTLTAFRAVEKHFQLRKLPSKHSRLHRTSPAQDVAALLRGVLDLGGVKGGPSSAAAAAAAAGARCHSASALPGQRLWTLSAHPGLVVIPGALTAEEQRRMMRDAFTGWPGPPNRTNHSAQLGPLPGLWEAAQDGLRLRPEIEGRVEAAMPSEQLPSHVTSGKHASSHESRVPGHSSCSGSIWCGGGDGPSARELQAKLRWATLGPPYDWTLRKYAATDSAPRLPQYLRDLAVRLAAAAGEATAAASVGGGTAAASVGEATDACGLPLRVAADGSSRGGGGSSCGCSGRDIEEGGVEFEPNAALINYYQSVGDTLCGHQDDAEGALEQPLVSMSVGCEAVFLIGGLDRECQPTALLLRSGDVLVMSGESRRCYHGVPRVLLSRPAAALDGHDDVAEGSVSGADRVLEHVTAVRLNISVRQVRQVVPQLSAAAAQAARTAC